MKLTEKDKARFWSKVDKSGDCWEWTACKNRKGYGQVRITGRLRMAHRVVWFLTHGSIPPGMCVCHTCDNPGCCNPDHLWAGTHQDNATDRENKGRGKPPRVKGEKHWNSRLTEKQVLEIRAKYIPWGYSQNTLAKEYDVSASAIQSIVERKIWKHI